MREMSSPWTRQMRHHIHRKLRLPHLDADHVIVGAGISGVASAYYLLTQTTANVTILEKGKIAHGATGHNAGQVAAYFDTPFDELVDRYGLDASIQAYEDVRSSWVRLEEILMHTKIPVPFHSFIGHAGCITEQDLQFHLQRKYLRQQKGLEIDAVLVAEERLARHPQSPAYMEMITPVPQATILDHLQTDDTQYIAALAMRKGTMNSALFCEELLSWMLTTYPDRLEVYTHTKVTTIDLYEKTVTLHCASHLPEHTIACKRVILATNGFVNFHIHNHVGPDIDATYAKNMQGIVGYMAGYLDTRSLPATAISYFVDPEQLSSGNDLPSYFYLTRRPFHTVPHEATLVCAGGPEHALQEHETYHHDLPYSPAIYHQLQEFLSHTHRYAPDNLHLSFYRHGLMGFTQSGVRVAGAEPKNPLLYYNIGCNGVGIMTAIYGAWRISQLLLDIPLEKSIFDPV